ncbi:hypothetical protein HYPSUDRAFT_67424 [Hypholoma sublateritium FD-334 SS-4]|uniref:Uncharacterized protein n=1 Tax=Hypholoma sublateritium (strain FD-334 SS-4) TaxID=945553 RepID=A0A0D2PPW1_HYPSF|nr:hypothetical protein HYPSUDRAFT_67424 [Hypholoma sublateritium FD-334 SS-4]
MVTADADLALRPGLASGSALHEAGTTADSGTNATAKGKLVTSLNVKCSRNGTT